MNFLKSSIEIFKNHYLVLIISIIAFFLYYPSLWYDFIYSLDDDWLIVSNPSIKDFSLKGIYHLFFGDNTDLHYHPLTYLSLAFDYQFFGLSPFHIKLHNLVLHILNGLLLYALILMLFKSRVVAFFAASFFLLASLNIESIAWPNCRRQSLSGFYFLISLILYLKSIKNKNLIGVYFLTSFFFFLLACLAKSSAFIMPFYVLLFYLFYYKPDKRLFIHFGLFFAASLVIVYLNLGIDQDNFLKRTFDYNIFEHIVFIFYSIGFYFVKFIFSYPQAIFYPAPSENLTIFPLGFYLVALLGLFIVVLLIYHYMKKQRVLFLVLALYFLSTIVMANRIIFPFQDLPVIVTDRYFYHNGYWVVAYLVLLVYYTFNKRAKYTIGFGVLMVILQVVYFKLYIPSWKNSITLMDYTVKNHPSEEFYYRLGIDYFKQKDYDNAVKSFNKADVLNTDIWINNDWYFYFEKSLVYLYDDNCFKFKGTIKKMIDRDVDKRFLNSYLGYIRANNCYGYVKEFGEVANNSDTSFNKIFNERIILKPSK